MPVTGPHRHLQTEVWTNHHPVSSRGMRWQYLTITLSGFGLIESRPSNRPNLSYFSVCWPKAKACTFLAKKNAILNPTKIYDLMFLAVRVRKVAVMHLIVSQFSSFLLCTGHNATPIHNTSVPSNQPFWSRISKPANSQYFQVSDLMDSIHCCCYEWHHHSQLTEDCTPSHLLPRIISCICIYGQCSHPCYLAV